MSSSPNAPYRKVGDKLKSNLRKITDEELDEFLELSGILGDFFYSDDAAKKFGFERRAIPGIMLYAVANGLISELFIGANPMHIASEKVRYLAPVYPGDGVQVEIEIVEISETVRGDGLIHTYDWVLSNDHGISVVTAQNSCIRKLFDR